MLTWWWYYNKY